MSTEGRQINKSAIRNFAIEARNILIKSAAIEAGFYGITKDEIKSPVQKGRDFEVYETLTGAEKRIFDSDVKRRAALVEAIRQKGFDEVMEETAYTWFNRLIAIRFMEVNNYLPFRMRVLSSDSGSLTPDIVSKSLEVDLNLTDRELDAIQAAKDENNYDEAFRLLFVKACNELNDNLPGLFEKTNDYMELLLKLPYTSDGVVRMLVDTIPESNFNINEGGQVEIIGWLYQFYNTEPKAKAFAKKGKITKEEIPAVTQLFTPDWIVRYMVENSLGRLWAEHLLANGDSRSEQEIANDFGWKYYLPEAEQEPEVQAQLVQIRAELKNLSPEDILCIDPCQGSGHILVYLFEVLMQIYREDGYSERDATRCILEHNLYGLDIDDRAYQLSYFAVLMKARQYDRMILKKHIKPHVYSIQESNSVNRNQLKYFGVDMSEIERNNAVNQLTCLLDTFKDAKEYGSILNVDRCDWDLLRRFAENDCVEGQMDFEVYGIDQTQKQLTTLIEIGEVMAQKYHVIATNPPYMAVTNADIHLYNFINANYKDSKADMYSVFIRKCQSMLKKHGMQAMITMQSWISLPSFYELRTSLIGEIAFVNVAQMGAHAFDEIGGEVVSTIAFIIRNSLPGDYIGCFSNLQSGGSESEKEAVYLKRKKLFLAKQLQFKSVPNSIFVYDVPESSIEKFVTAPPLKDYVVAKPGMQTSDNERFLKLWFEVDVRSIGYKCTHEEAKNSNYKWFPYNKGIGFRKWYGNNDYIVNFFHDGEELKYWLVHNPKDPGTKHWSRNMRNYDYYFQEGITFTAIGNAFSARLNGRGYLFDTKGPTMFGRELIIICGFVNSTVFDYYNRMLCKQITKSADSVNLVPFILPEGDDYKAVQQYVKDAIAITKADWDSYETSWDFKKHPLIGIRGTVESSFNTWSVLATERANKLTKTEKAIDKTFETIYGIENEIAVKDRIEAGIVRRADKVSDIKSLISYAVGCMFGRYSLDVEGLAYAGGDWKEAYVAKYKTFMPDEDGIIPITDEEYFKDDIVARFVDFIRIVYGEETLEENLKFIADVLGNKGDTPRAVIRNYFMNDFYKDHCNTYSVTGSGKRPIYWLFDSGKQNGFKALIYIHRYTPDTVGLIRSVYLHNAQAAIQNSLQNAEYIISTTTSATERARETRKKDKYVKQLNELRPYYQALSHIALQRIPMDLDNGVKKNYQLFQGVEVSTEGRKKQTINLLAKI